MSQTPVFRILLIEDDPSYRLLLREMVEGAADSQFEIVAEAERLSAGVELIEQGNCDVILLDLNLPDSDGVETLKIAHRAAGVLPIIVLTGVDDDELAVQTVHSGAQEYLVKGHVDAHLLQRTLRYAIERAKVEAELARERDLLQTLLENIPDRIYFKDTESRFTLINRALTRLFKLKAPEEAYGKTDADFYGMEHAEAALSDEQRVMHTGVAMLGKIEKEELHDGRRSWSLTSKLPLRNGGGRIIGTCGISREITTLKNMEEQLAIERRLLRAVIDNVPDLIYLKDASGGYLLDNAAHLRWIGCSEPEEIIGKTVYDFYPAEMARRFQADDDEVFRHGKALLNREEKVVDCFGAERWVLTTKVPWRDEERRIVGLVCIGRDITEQKLAEESLRTAYADLARSREEVLAGLNKLQAAHTELREVQLQLVEAEKMKSVGRLAAGVAHEVKNPLAVIKMGIDFLTSQSFTDDTVPIILAEMEESVKRADAVIRGLLDFSAPKKLEVSAVDLNQIIDSALKMVRGEMKGECEVIRELQPSLPALSLDAGKIAQVLVNIFTNALHAMNGVGTLAVRTYSRQLTGVGSNIGSRISESFRVGRTLVVIEIDDTGSGVPEDKLSKVFDPFFTTKPTGAGTGLGLSVSKTIIDLHGGTIDIRNRHEGGARVTIMLQV